MHPRRGTPAFRVLAAGALLLAGCRSAPGTVAQAPDDPLDVLREEMRRTGAPGAAVAVVVGDRVVLSAAFGVRSVEERAPATTSTLFRVGSVTKSVTGLAAAVLAQQGRLDLDAPIAARLPTLGGALGRRTLRQLLEHRAGLWNEAAGDGRHDDDALAARVDHWGDERLFAPAGDVHSYSSPGYWLAGRVLERATGAAYADVVASTVFAPLGMTRSVFRPTTALTYPLALDHVGRGDSVRVLRPFPDDASTWPSGSLFTTADDLARLAIALLNDGRLDGRQALPREAVAAMSHGGSRVPGGECRYAFGLQRCARAGGETMSHYGFRRGSGAVFTLVPARRVGIVVLAVGQGAIMSRTEASLLARYAGIADAPPPRPSVRGPVPAGVLGTWVAGADTLRLARRGATTTFAFGRGEELPAWEATDGAVLVGPRDAPVQRFTIVRGDAGDGRYLHDGLGAYRHVSP